MELIHEEDGAAVPDEFFQQVLEPLFEVAAVLRTSHEAGHVQRQQTPPLEHPGYLLVGDALGKPFGQRGLAHARFAHKAGVVLLAAA